MTIRREQKIFGNTTLVTEFELTDEELEQAFRERDHQYMLEDAERQLEEYLSDDADDDAYMRETYLATFDELTSPESKSYSLDYLVERFSDEQDCNVAENVVWQNVIRDALEDVKSRIVRDEEAI